MVWTLHADKNTTDLPVDGIPLLHKIINGLPTTQIQIANTEV